MRATIDDTLGIVNEMIENLIPSSVETEYLLEGLILVYNQLHQLLEDIDARSE